ncbi:MAG: hypothetical protein EVA36_04085 [Flavobacteriales bacterium]|nr:MAG: hypothetical protein EVA36_04085 [Flavobacteriales bacterium]|tara:strand:+ start:1497 stop:1802 length:306 start_codon:yes stop_codon:yes gene_type:complete
MLGLHDIQYFYEFLFWLFIYLSLRLVWHLPNVRFAYGIAVAIFNLAAIVMYTISSLAGQIGPLDAFAFAFLHSMVSVVMLTLIYRENKIDKKKRDLKGEKY